MTSKQTPLEGKDKNVLTGGAPQEEDINAKVYKLNVCRDGNLKVLKLYGPKSQ